MSLDEEMEEISRIWRSAKDQLNNHQEVHRKQLEKKKAHYEKIRADGESFKQMKRQQQQASSSERIREDKENSKPRSVWVCVCAYMLDVCVHVCVMCVWVCTHVCVVCVCVAVYVCV